MNQLSVWQMVVDFGLVCAVLTMAFRWMKSSRAQALLPQTLELEAALKNLIADAEVAGKHLNDQLLRRESTIQKYLTELEESEKRITRSVVEGEEVGKRIETIAESAQTKLQELVTLREAHTRGISQPSSEVVGSTLNRPVQQSQRNAAGASAQQRSPSGSTQQASTGGPRNPATQGHPMKAPAARQGASAQTQGARINTQSDRTEGAQAREVYAAAEKMVRDGVDLEQVAATTRLPLEGIKRLSQMIEVERSESARSQEGDDGLLVGDPRLGALGVTRRQPTV